MRERRKFSEEFMKDAVARATAPGAVVSHVAEELDLVSNVLHRWVKRETQGRKAYSRKSTGEVVAAAPALASPPPNGPDKKDEEIARLREEVAKLTKERDKLKSTLAFYIADE